MRPASLQAVLSMSYAQLESCYSEEQELSSQRSLGLECYLLPTKATWASSELNKSFVAKCGGLAWRKTQRSIVKPAMGVSWSVVPLPQNLLGPHPYQMLNQILAETKFQPEGHAAAKPEVPHRRSQRQSLAPSYLNDYYT